MQSIAYLRFSAMAETKLGTAEDQLRSNIPLREPNHPEAHFPEEQKGWHGYIEWEKYPEKKAEAAKVLAQYTFAGVRRS